MSKGCLIALLLVSPVTFSGCVSYQTFAEKEAELNAVRDELKSSQDEARTYLNTANTTRAELNACRTQAESDLGAAKAARSALERELIDTQVSLDQCSRNAEIARQYQEMLKVRENKLREKLKAELAAGLIELNQIQDQISVCIPGHVLFSSGRAEILPEGKKVLDKLVAALALTDDMIRVEAHTDIMPLEQRPKEKYFLNWGLSGARASSVVHYLEAGKEIRPARIEAAGMSRYRPFAPADSPEDLQRNPRIEIVLKAPPMHETAALKTGQLSP